MALPLEKVGQVAAVGSKSFMKGKASGVIPSGGGSVELDINFDTIYADSVQIEGFANMVDSFSKITTIDNTIGIIAAKTENLSVGSVDNMTVYYQTDGAAGGDEIVLVNRIINKARNMWVQGVFGFGPLQDDISRKIWLDKPDDIKKAADNAYAANEIVKTIKSANHLEGDWLFRYYSPEGLGASSTSSAYYNLMHTADVINRILQKGRDPIDVTNPFGTDPFQVKTYTLEGYTEALKDIKQVLDAIKVKVDSYETRLQSIATDASGANVKAGSAERHAIEIERLIKEEVKAKFDSVIKQLRSSCAWVLDGCCRLVKNLLAPMKECFSAASVDQSRDTWTIFEPIFEEPNFGVSGNVEGENAELVFYCPTISRPFPYWPLSVAEDDRGETNFRSIVEDLPQAVAAYYWPSAYQGAEK